MKKIVLTDVSAWVGTATGRRYIKGMIGPTKHVISYAPLDSGETDTDLVRFIGERAYPVPSKGKALPRFLAIMQAFDELGPVDRMIFCDAIAVRHRPSAA